MKFFAVLAVLFIESLAAPAADYEGLIARAPEEVTKRTAGPILDKKTTRSYLCKYTPASIDVKDVDINELVGRSKWTPPMAICVVAAMCM
ncbi:hypothetical protein BDD12DRAFT_883614 [Trichophaea hybrida]|nr:hypothetical protein BDD12DRAFT_883614 [Trichophaea hybrida]